MIDNRQVERDVLGGLTAWLRSRFPKPVELVRANQTGPAPPYPYAAYTVTTTLQQKGGSFGEAQDGSFFKEARQTWSMTVASDDHDEGLTVAQLCHDYLAQAGSTALADAGIVVAEVGGVTNRDNLISIEYEKRQGFDFSLSLVNRIDTNRNEMSGWIEAAPLHSD